MKPTMNIQLLSRLKAFTALVTWIRALICMNTTYVCPHRVKSLKLHGTLGAQIWLFFCVYYFMYLQLFLDSKCFPTKIAFIFRQAMFLLMSLHSVKAIKLHITM